MHMITLLPSFNINKGNINFQITKWFDEKNFYKKIIVTDKGFT